MEKSASGLSNEATLTLINIWGDGDVQGKLDSVKRNKDIFQQIVKDLHRIPPMQTPVFSPDCSW